MLAAAVDLDTRATVAKNDLGCIRVLSEGYPLCRVELDDLEQKPEEAGTTTALIRGVAARFAQLGATLEGIDAYVTSTVLPGSGLSSSATRCAFSTPAQISARLKKEGTFQISASTIYRALEHGQLRDSLRFFLRHKYKMFGKASKKRRKCFESRIEDRSAEANDRSEIGHFEGDTIIGHGHRSCIVTLVDRKSRFLLAGKCALAVGARHEREHERTAAAVLFQGARTG